MKKKALLAAGCFWGIEDQLSKVKGVLETSVGYSGGETENPTYEEVCSGSTSHAEVVLVTYDPSVISYKKLLEIFFSIHDASLPHQKNQYRSEIFYFDSDQKKTADDVLSDLENRECITTKITLAKPFYKAEEYHQKYLKKNQ